MNNAATTRTVLITGGGGFIGSHLVERMLADGWAVVVLDDFSTGRRENLMAVAESAALQIVEGSVCDAPLVARLVAEADAVVHLAAAVGVRLIVEQPARTLETNIQGATNVLDAAAAGGTRILLASTSEVYGKSSAVPFTEEADLVLGPSTHSRWGYACSKLADEFLAMAYHAQSALPVTVCRLFNTVGPRQVGRYGMVVPRFVDWALAGKPLEVYGRGEQTRCFCHVGDTVEALARLLANDEAAGEVVNVGADAEISILDLARRVNESTDNAAGVVHRTAEEAYGRDVEDMQRRVPSIDKLEALTAFRPQRTLDDILRDVIAEKKG
ncbi:MAG: NAD-dependent epimerase/dehydratase family protein [Phycisphaerales bacterium]|jgi:UDP-glucose 4-epimerase|nr:NAD-dependent epimerase/dehydratase family protein [Phycisphaerales bacterium]MBT7171934.1 NAD-dependent epimerase/dehydratase family protein [Phycisphaerales bacterium]